MNVLALQVNRDLAISRGTVGVMPGKKNSGLRALGEEVGNYLDFVHSAPGVQRHRFTRELFALSRKLTPRRDAPNRPARPPLSHHGLSHHPAYRLALH